MDRRVVVEVEAELHQKLRRLAVLNDLKIYVLVNAIIKDCISDEEHVKTLIRHLKH